MLFLHTVFQFYFLSYQWSLHLNFILALLFVFRPFFTFIDGCIRLHTDSSTSNIHQFLVAYPKHANIISLELYICHIFRGSVQYIPCNHREIWVTQIVTVLIFQCFICFWPSQWPNAHPLWAKTCSLWRKHSFISYPSGCNYRNHLLLSKMFCKFQNNMQLIYQIIIVLLEN